MPRGAGGLLHAADSVIGSKKAIAVKHTDGAPPRDAWSLSHTPCLKRPNCEPCDRWSVAHQYRHTEVGSKQYADPGTRITGLISDRQRRSNAAHAKAAAQPSAADGHRNYESSPWALGRGRPTRQCSAGAVRGTSMGLGPMVRTRPVRRSPVQSRKTSGTRVSERVT